MTNDTSAIVLALRHLAKETPGQIPRGCMLEAANKLEEQAKQIEEIKQCTN